MSFDLAKFLQTLSDDDLAERMSGFKPGTKERILGEQEFHRRRQERTEPLANERAMSKIKVFVSHSSKDAELASKLVDLLRASLPIRPNEIRCTSIEGHRLPGGAKTDPSLQKEISDADTFIGIITPASLESAYVRAELGARWGTDKHLVPLLGHGARTSDLPGPLTGYNALRCDKRPQLYQLIRELGEELKLTAYDPEHYDEQLERVIVASQRQVDVPEVEHLQAMQSVGLAAPPSVTAPDPSQLSEQAKDILRQLVHSGQERVVTFRDGGNELLYSVLKDPQLQFSDPDSVDEDFGALTDAELLLVDYQSNGNPTYWLTRKGAFFGRTL